MRLTIVIPTYNRSQSLARTLRSLLTTTVPSGHQIRILAVDNRSSDNTKAVIQAFAGQTSGVVQYVAEHQNQGRSFALNAGIRASGDELLGFIDDDEEIDERWFEVIFDVFADPNVDYIGGRYLPLWESQPPDWVNHPHTRTAIGWADFGERRRLFSEPGFDALLMGGNSVLRRRCFDRVGLYSPLLGRTGNRLLAGEDADMHDRLIAAGLVGVYLPELIVHHHIPVQRLRRAYMRRWAFWSSVSDSIMLRGQSATAPQWFNVPRSLYVRAFQSPARWLRAIVGRRGAAEVFHHELTVWRFAGRFYGRNLRRAARP